MSTNLRRIAFAFACLVAAPAVAQDGGYDPRFGNYLPGRTLHRPLPDNMGQVARSIAVMPDGRLVLGGHAAVIRLDASGMPDPSFGNTAFGAEGAFAVQPFGAQAGVLDVDTVLRQADGRLLIVGSAEASDSRHRIVACLTSADGVLDAGYGVGGCADYVVEQGRETLVAGAALDPSGRLVLAAYGTFSFGSRIVVVRLHSDGTLDTSYGTNGRTVIVRFDELAGGETRQVPKALAIDAQGRAIVVGDSVTSNAYDFAIARLGSDGFLDASFGDGGVRVVDFAGQQQPDGAFALALQRSGRILVAGGASYTGTSVGMAVLALTDAGDVDETFGNLVGGRSITWPFAVSAYAYAVSIAVQGDGRIVLAGHGRNPADGGAAGQDVAIVRLHADGTGPDTSFATAGVFVAGFNLGMGSSYTRDDRVNAVALQGNRIVAAGFADDDASESWFSAIRLTEDRVFADGVEAP